jgi:opacity protein-like surface antigen
MKKFLLVFLVLVLLSSASFAANLSDRSGVVGLDFPTIGGINRNNSGQITGTWGLNIALGLSVKNYFKPVKTNDWNAFWGFGTIVVLIPYIGVGADYVWDNGFYAGFGFPTVIQAGYLF